MTAATKNFLLAMAAQMPKKEKGFSDYVKELLVNGKYNLKGILTLAWREVKRYGRTLSSALSYAWDIAKSQMQSLKRNTNLDLRVMGFTRLD